MLCSIKEALAEWEAGRPLIVVDHEERENEGDLIVPACLADEEMVNFFITEAKGLLCAPVSSPIASRTGLHPMIPNADKNTCNFAISIDSRQGCTTGISAAERARTIETLANKKSTALDFIRPGHMFPVLAKEGGTLVRAGHTEATIDLCRLAGYEEVGMICEIINEDGSMSRLPDLKKFSEKHGLKIFAIDTLIAHRKKTETALECIEQKKIFTRFGEFTLSIFQELGSSKEHIALSKGDLSDYPVVRVHSENFVSDIFLEQSDIEKSMKYLAQQPSAALIYIRHNILDREKNIPQHMRSYGIGAQILQHLGIGKMKLLTHSTATQKKIPGLKAFGLSIGEYISL